MENISKFKKWAIILEMATRERKCPIIDFTPLRERTVYKDVMSLGFVECDPRGVPVFQEGEAPKQGEKQGNLRFIHPDLQNGLIIRTNMNGAVWLDEKGYITDKGSLRSGNAKKLDLVINNPNNPNFQECLTLEAYERRLDFLGKYLLYLDKWLTLSECLNSERFQDIVKRKIEEDPSSLKSLRRVPESMEEEYDELKRGFDYGWF